MKIFIHGKNGLLYVALSETLKQFLCCTLFTVCARQSRGLSAVQYRSLLVVISPYFSCGHLDLISGICLNVLESDRKVQRSIFGKLEVECIPSSSVAPRALIKDPSYTTGIQSYKNSTRLIKYFHFQVMNSIWEAYMHIVSLLHLT